MQGHSPWTMLPSLHQMRSHLGLDRFAAQYLARGLPVNASRLPREQNSASLGVGAVAKPSREDFHPPILCQLPAHSARVPRHKTYSDKTRPLSPIDDWSDILSVAWGQLPTWRRKSLCTREDSHCDGTDGDGVEVGSHCTRTSHAGQLGALRLD